MKNQENGKATVTQGVGEPVESKVVSELSMAQVQKFLDNDVLRCIGLLNAINQDPDLRRMMAQWFYGVIHNSKNKPDPSQMHMFNTKDLA